MMIWLTLLPFTLWDNCGWAMLPITFIVSFLLLGKQSSCCCCCNLTVHGSAFKLQLQRPSSHL
jgi:hypothetical protein